MRKSHVISTLGAFAAGIALVVTTAACAPDAPAPAPVVSCPEGQALAEDNSCVPTTFWDAVDHSKVSVENVMEALSVACITEDSDNCYWRADLMGNGTGTSFVNVEGNIFPLTTILTTPVQ